VRSAFRTYLAALAVAPRQAPSPPTTAVAVALSGGLLEAGVMVTLDEERRIAQAFEDGRPADPERVQRRILREAKAYMKQNPKDRLALRFKKALKDERRRAGRRRPRVGTQRPAGATLRRPRTRSARPRRRGTSPARAGPSDGPEPERPGAHPSAAQLTPRSKGGHRVR
jgi:hypothetical protein